MASLKSNASKKRTDFALGIGAKDQFHFLEVAIPKYNILAVANESKQKTSRGLARQKFEKVDVYINAQRPVEVSG